VVESLGEELEALVGTAVHVELRRRLGRPHRAASIASDGAVQSQVEVNDPATATEESERT